MAPASFLPEDRLLFSYLLDLNDLEKTQERNVTFLLVVARAVSVSRLAIIYLTDDDSLSSVVWPEPFLEER